MPVVPATWEDEAEWLEHGRWRLWLGEIMPLHSSLGDRVTICCNKETKTKKKQEQNFQRKENLNFLQYTINNDKFSTK